MPRAKSMRKAVYYRTTTDGRTKWVRIPGISYSEQLRRLHFPRPPFFFPIRRDE